MSLLRPCDRFAAALLAVALGAAGCGRPAVVTRPPITSPDGAWEPVPPGAGLAEADSDEDGLDDELERRLGSDPRSPDGDGDGFGDALELLLGEAGFDPTVVTVDGDRDGLADGFEAAIGSSPERLDSDGDGWGDFDEQLHRRYGFDPAVPTEDADYDGLGDELESAIGTSAAAVDSDGDGVSDFEELATGDPRDPGLGGALRESVSGGVSAEMRAALEALREGASFPPDLAAQLPYSEVTAAPVLAGAVRPTAALLLLSLHNPANSPGIYPEYDEVLDEIDRIRRRFGPGGAGPDVVRVFRWSRPTVACCRGGANFPGRSLYAVKISDAPASNEDEPEILVMAMHHAYELVTTSIGLGVIRELTSRYAAGQADVRALVDAAEIWVFPVVNPNGYQHALDTGAWWRKNRNRNPAAQVRIGVDLNRNYGFEHLTGLGAPARVALGAGVLDPNGAFAAGPNAGQLDVDSDTYPGTAGFTEVETGAVAGLANNAFRDRDGIDGLRCTLSFHTYGGVVGHPLAHDVDPGSAQLTAAEDASLDALSAAVAAATGYQDAAGDFELLRLGAGDPYDGYSVYGDSDDWLHRVAGAQSILVEAYSAGERAAAAEEFFPDTAVKRDAVVANNVRGALALADFCTRADFGDTDSTFPTRADQNGPRHLETDREWLGRLLVPARDAVGRELDAVDATDRDGVPNLLEPRERWDLDRFDDGVVFFPLTYRPGETGVARFTVCVDATGPRYDPADPDKSLYVNAWIDWDTDFAFEEANAEHVLDGLRLAPKDVSSWAPLGQRGAATVTQIATATDGRCALYEAGFRVGALGRRPTWARFRLDYGEDVGRNDPRPEHRSRPGLRERTLAAGAPQPPGRPFGFARGAARYGEVEDYLIGTDFGDAPDPFRGPGRYPTRRQPAGARHLDLHREWLGVVRPGGYPDAATRETDGCDLTAAEEDGVPNLGGRCQGADQDAEDQGAVVPAVVAPGQTVTVVIDVSARVDDYGFANRGPGGEDSAGRATLKPDCTLGPIADATDTPAIHRDRGRYAAWDTRRRLYLDVWADWNADGEWSDAERVIRGPLDPEDWGADGRYTLGEPFTDGDANQVRTDGEAFTDVAGVATRRLRCEVTVPDDVARPGTFFWRFRLDYGENAVTGTAVVAHVDEPARTLAGPRGGALWGEVEDHPSRAGEVDRYESSLAELEVLTPGGPVTLLLSGPAELHVDVYAVADTDGDGREQVAAEMALLELRGDTPAGPAVVRLRPASRHPFRRSTGEIEEVSNATQGVLDLPPFTPTGTAESCFDVYFELDLAGELLHSHEPKRMCETIRHKPPGEGHVYFDPTRVRLFGEDEAPSAYSVGATRHVPEPGSERERERPREVP